MTVTNTGTLAVAGTSNQVLVNGGTSSANGNITLSLPQNIGTGSSPTFAGLTNNGTYTQSTTSTQPVYITGDSGDTSGIFRIQIDSVSDSFGTGARTFLGDGGIDIFLGTGNSSYTPGNTYIALNHSGEISMGAGSATKHFTLSTGGNLTISGTIGASNLSGTNTGDQTLNSLGALSSNTDSEQVVGCHDVYWNYGTGVIKSDARWNESGYDADLGTLHLYSTTAAGVNYGRAGIALYNGSAYQYLTTKASTTGLFVNNSLIATAGSSPTFVSVTGTITSSGTGDSNAPFKFSADYSGWMSHVAGTPGSNNGWGLFWAGNSGAQYGTNGTGGPGDIWSNSGNPNEYVFVGNGQTNMSVNGNTGNVWIGGQLRVKGDLLPNANNSYDLGSSSLGWRNVYTNDLHLSNMNKPEGNDIDGTNGNWTIQEGAEQLYIINNNNGKKFKIDLTEII